MRPPSLPPLREPLPAPPLALIRPEPESVLTVNQMLPPDPPPLLRPTPGVPSALMLPAACRLPLTVNRIALPPRPPKMSVGLPLPVPPPLPKDVGAVTES